MKTEKGKGHVETGLAQIVRKEELKKSIESDKNHSTYKKLLQDDNWYAKHKGLYIIIVDGKHVDTDKDRIALLERSRKSYAKAPRYFTRVNRDEEVIDMSSDLTFEPE